MELYHYGVKGMRWGVRKDRKKAAITDSKETPSRKSINKKRTFDMDKASRRGRLWIHDNAFLNMQFQQANQWAMEQTNRASINAALQSVSLSISGGTNPFMFAPV
jgi:hypothetical protein